MIEKRAISKNYFHWIPYDGKIYDQRIVDKFLYLEKDPNQKLLLLYMQHTSLKQQKMLQ